MNTFKINNFSYDRKTNITNLTCSIGEKNYKLSFPSNPLLEVDILESHEKKYDEIIIRLSKIIKNQEYDFKTLNSLKQFYYEINREISVYNTI
jgi:hypothetical protein